MKQIASILTILCPLLLIAADGDLDTSFGSGGKLTTSFGGTDDEASGIFVQPDSKIVTVGFTNASGGYDFALSRYNSDGSLDTSFGSNGKVSSNFGASDDQAFAGVLQSDGKIIAAGLSGGDCAVARYNTNGSLDTSFGNGGIVTTDFGANPDEAFSVLIQPDGKIVIAGTDSQFAFVLARYKTNGSLDTSFGTNGLIFNDLNNAAGHNAARDVLLQSDGKIIAVGFSDKNGKNINYDFVLIRYTTNGSLDTSFGSSGVVFTDFSGAIDQAFAGTLQPNGKIIAVGLATISGTTNFGIARYNTDGSLDTSFGTGGKVTTNFGGTAAQARAVSIESDGKILVSGFTTISGTTLFGIVRLNSDGSLDTSFGTNGKVTTNFGGSTNEILSMFMQPDGKIDVSGFSNASGNNSFALARYVVPSIIISTLAKDIRAKYSLVPLS